MRFFYFLALLTVLVTGCAGGGKTPTGKPERLNQSQPDQQVLGYDEDGHEYKIKYIIVEIKGQKYIVLTSVNGWRESGICPLIER